MAETSNDMRTYARGKVTEYLIRNGNPGPLKSLAPEDYIDAKQEIGESLFPVGGGIDLSGIPQEGSWDDFAYEVAVVLTKHQHRNFPELTQ